MNRDCYFKEKTETHFIKRARIYNHSSNWVQDNVLIDKIYSMSSASQDDIVLDIAIGTGKISEAFYGRVRRVIGIDICWDMISKAFSSADGIILGQAECMPFKENSFDICVCRQGLQFMDVEKVLLEIFRILRVGGRIVLCHLTSYGEQDKDISFHIQSLRNPARKNFFMPMDFPALLKRFDFKNIEYIEYISRESVNQWINNGAISEQSMAVIKDVYFNAPEYFKRSHNIEFSNNDIYDSMKFVIVKGVKNKE